ncbi:MAG: nucleotidyltransferase domain-containing protein [Spirochaetales bacterium]|nr:nucleotidyltransferase domain-containing protein [Spirochaetales bacterium]
MINDEIREMTRRFVEALHPVKVILFGSYAKDTYRDDSDYDFYIIMPDDTKMNMIEAGAAAYHSLRDMNDRKAVDILTNTQGKFDYRKNQPTMERIAEREGVVLYG